MNGSKLIILRGPSGSGKSTVSKILFKKAKSKICLIEQDYYRFIFKPAGGGTKPNLCTIQKMIKSDTLFALNDGYDVILEGILGEKSYGKILEQIFAEHPNNNFMYYFDISFEETVKRHETRKITRGSGFSKDDMRKWYSASYKSGHKLEQIIPESFLVDDTVSKILLETQL